jgi:murein L,D-transpeptidase YcbB/YkuD
MTSLAYACAPAAALAAFMTGCSQPATSATRGPSTCAVVKPVGLEGRDAGTRDAIASLTSGTGAPAWLEASERALVEGLYRRGDYEPLWVDGNRVKRADALALLRTAPDDGLDPALYDVTGLEQRDAALPKSTAAERASFDVRLSASVLKYFRHLHAGRIDPRTLGFRLDVPTDDHDYGALLEAAIANGTLTQAVDALRPSPALYGALRAHLSHYRALAAGAPLPVPPKPVQPVRPGDEYTGALAVHRLLLALGDLHPEAPPPDSGRYGGGLVDGVMRFQARHGLTPDGVIGTETMKAMQTPVGWRLQQIALGLERLRWLPHADAGRLILINIPMFRLWAWDSTPPAGPPQVATDVIVGRAIRTETPVIVEELREVIFRPDWMVPRSILRHELLPEVLKDTGYLRTHDMEIVPAGGGRPLPPTPENLARLAQGGVVLRQRPGPRNALGLVKFVFPNLEHVYLHDTPAKALFSRSRRDFSHGCVRVRDPIALAAWALEGRPQWTRDRIGAALLGEATIRVAVSRRTRVVLFYTTAMASPEDGTLRFADDIYRHDPILVRR